MISRMIIFVFAVLGTTAFADPEDDAEWFMSHFMEQRYWDSAYRIGLHDLAKAYEQALSNRNITVEDFERFQDLIPHTASEDYVKRSKHEFSIIIIEHFGPDYLAEIASFFRTPLGEEILAIENEQKFFSRLHFSEPWGGTLGIWKSNLSAMQVIEFSTFSSTPAGQFFMSQTLALRPKLRRSVFQRGTRPDPPLDRPYIIEITQTDGILRFANPIARRSLLNELSASNP